MRQSHVLRIGDLLRSASGRRAVVYGMRMTGGGLLALLRECYPGGAKYGLTKRGPVAGEILGRDLEVAAMAWACNAVEADVDAGRARRAQAAAVYRRISVRARRNEARLRALADRWRVS